MQYCWCKAAGLDDGQHIFDHCKYDENGKPKAMVAATAASTASSSASAASNADQIAVIAAAAKKFMEQPADATSETHHAKSAVVTPPEDTDTLMNDEAMSD